MFKQTSNQASGYLQQLDQWLDEAVTGPLVRAYEEYAFAVVEAGVDKEEAAAALDPVIAGVRKALKEKVLESYHNGQAAAPRRTPASGRYSRSFQYASKR